MNLNAINCVITGISGETGKALSEHLMEKGATVIGTSRPNPEGQEFTLIAANQYGIAMDPLNHDSTQKAVNILAAHLQQIHVWINVVGGFEMGETLENSSVESWKRMLDVNFQTVLNTTQAILPHFKKFKTGRLINFGSAAADTGMALAAPYLVSKSAVHALTKACAAELSGDITCNALLPGTIDTAKNRSAMPDADFSTWVSPLTIAEQVINLIEGSMNGELLHL